MSKRARIEFKDIKLDTDDKYQHSTKNLNVYDYNLYDLTEESSPPPPPQSPPPLPNRMGEYSKYASSSYKLPNPNNDEYKKEMDELLIQEGELKLLLTKIRRKIKDLAVKRGMV
jgi:hypothetical protein